MVELVAFYKSTQCTNGFYTEKFENGHALPTVTTRHCDVCDKKHTFTHETNHMAGSSSALKLLEDWAERNQHEFNISLKDIE